MSHIPANIRLQAGDTVHSLTGLKDCGSGRCINLRLDGKAVAPQGWAAVCQPPPAKKFFQIVNGYYRLRVGKVGHYQGEKNFRTLQEAQAALAAFLPAKAIDAKAALWSGQMGLNKTYAVGPYTGSSSDDDVVDVSFHLEEKPCPPNNALAVCQTAAWPYDTCSEIIYRPAQGSFQPACAEHDPHLPEPFRNSRPCLSLCDAEGKRVRIRHTAAGIEIYQQKYQQAVLLDSKTLNVKALTANTTVPELAVTVNGQPAAGKRHKLTIGGHATLAANQTVTVRADGKLIKQTPNSNGSISLLGMAAGQLLVQVLTDCEGVELEFEITDPKEEFIRELWSAIRKYGITNANELAALLANSDHETGGGIFLVENSNFRFINWKGLNRNTQRWTAEKGNNAESDFSKLSTVEKFNIMYQNMNGNTLPDDGFRFRGRGGIHITGRDTYQKFSQYINNPQIMDNPDLISSDPKLAAESTVWFWTKYKPDLAKVARDGRFDEVRRIVNGGRIGKTSFDNKLDGYLKGAGTFLPPR